MRQVLVYLDWCSVPKCGFQVWSYLQRQPTSFPKRYLNGTMAVFAQIVKNTMFPSLIVNQHFFPSSWIVLIDCLKIFHRFWSCSLVPDSPIIISWLFPLAFPSYLNDIPIIFTTCSCHSNIIMSYIICKKVLYHSLFMTLNIPYSYISLVYIPLYTDTLNIPSILGPEVKAAEVRDSSDSSAAVGWCFFLPRSSPTIEMIWGWVKILVPSEPQNSW